MRCPFVATWLVASSGSPVTPAYYLMGVAVIGLITVLTLVRETRQLSLTRTTVR